MSVSRRDLFLILGITTRFELERKYLAAGFGGIAALRERVHNVGHDVVQEPLVMGDDDEGAVGRRAAG